MTAENLVLSAMNDRPTHDAIVSAIERLRSTMDRCAARAARANAEWHDDPQADDHADYHAPADVQYPRDVRDEAIRELVAHYLCEMALSEAARAK
jgi:hypothetical protein